MPFFKEYLKSVCVCEIKNWTDLMCVCQTAIITGENKLGLSTPKKRDFSNIIYSVLGTDTAVGTRHADHVAPFIR
jgi:hypothetical protein